MNRVLLAVSALLILCACASAAEPKLVPLTDVGQHVGEKITVDVTVQSGRLLESGKFCFLNSKKSYTDKENFTVSIRGKALDSFTEQGIEDPAEHFLKKKIRVTGKVSLYKEKPQIVVDTPEQIVVVLEIK